VFNNAFYVTATNKLPIFLGAKKWLHLKPVPIFWTPEWMSTILFLHNKLWPIRYSGQGIYLMKTINRVT